MGLAIAVLAPAFLFLGAFIAIPAMLIFALALPIYLGWKIPRQLALAGLVVLVVSAPIAAAGDVSLLTTPVGPVSSDSTYPFANGNGSVLADAQVTPYHADPGTTFTFTVNYQPQYFPGNYTKQDWALLFISSCPGATGNSSPNCTPGYPYISRNTTIADPATPQTIRWSVEINGTNVWWWQIGVAATNASKGLVWVFLDAGNNFGTVQGPVTGSSVDIFGYILPAFYEELLLYAGLPFYLALLAYLIFKVRERRRIEAQMAAAAASEVPPIESGSGPKEAPPTTPAPSAPVPAEPEERHCPNCGAVVYLNETTCWKCGTTLGSSGSGAPLPSGPR